MLCQSTGQRSEGLSPNASLKRTDRSVTLFASAKTTPASLATYHDRWEAGTMLNPLGGIGDFLSGLGVIVTLIYLAIQIRHNTKSARTQSYQAAIAAISD